MGGEIQYFPVPQNTPPRVLGIDVDWFLALGRHFASMLKKAQVRQGMLSRSARRSLGLEWGVLEMNHDAVVASLLRDVLRFAGPRPPKDAMIVDVAARPIAGLS